MASLRLTASRTISRTVSHVATNRYRLEITKSRICPEGRYTEVAL